jgi:hypothetical protein
MTTKPMAMLTDRITYENWIHVRHAIAFSRERTVRTATAGIVPIGLSDMCLGQSLPL